jgi:hypothetical protein
MNISTDIIIGTLLISDKFDIGAATSSASATPQLLQPEEEYILSFPEIRNVKKLTRFTYDTLGLTDNRYLLQQYRISRDESRWTDWLDLKRNIDNFPLIDVKDPFYLEVKWIRKGFSTIGAIKLLEYKIEGELERPVNDEVGANTINSNSSLVIKPPFIYKVFKISDIEIISSTGVSGCTIKWRYSQDSSKTWSNWELFTKENVTTKRISPIRFFQIEYLIENNSDSNIKIQDINLIGDFQNVTNDYYKTNLFGIRECCQSNIMGTTDVNGNFVPGTNWNQGSGNTCDSNGLPQMTTDEKANLYNPYQQNQAINLLQKLSNDAQMIFGHRVIYFATDADRKGQDSIMHEYQLYNVVCEAEIKVSVEGNNFPDSQIVMNQFDLNLFETMQVHITKQQFKEVFGVQRRPSKEDFLYFCDINRMFQVDHAQQFRNFNNAAVYYKLILKKYSQKANMQTSTIEIKQTIDRLTKNSTIDELMGIETAGEKLAIANKDQFAPLTREVIRLEYLVPIEKELIENSTTIISKSHYDLSAINFGETAIKYLNFKPSMKVSDNLGYQIWFNINNYIEDEVYNFFNFYSGDLGCKVDLVNDQIKLKMNSDEYIFNLDSDLLDENVWYCLVINIEQRNRLSECFIYKRDVDEEEDAGRLSYTLLRNVYKESLEIEPIEFESEGWNPEILSSDMKVTNIRLFADVIPESTHNKICNQIIIRDDSKYLIFADNANTRILLPRFPLFE